MPNKLILTHGLPSSGKSTLAHKLKQEAESKGLRAVVLETDDFFMVDGKYCFDYSQLQAAHAWNFNRCSAAFKENINLIVVANTNLTWREIRPYASAAQLFNYDVEIVEPDTPWKDDVAQLFEKNKTTHAVPMEAYERMVQKKQSVEYLREKIRMLDIEGYEW